MNPYELAAEAAKELKQKTGVNKFDVAVVLGSGWKEGAVALGEPSSSVLTSELTGFFKPTVAGHQGQILAVEYAGLHVALLAGRVHLYEGHTAHEVAHPVRTLIAAGAQKIVFDGPQDMFAGEAGVVGAGALFAGHFGGQNHGMTFVFEGFADNFL